MTEPLVEDHRCRACGADLKMLSLVVDGGVAPVRLARCRACRSERWVAESAAADDGESEYWELYKAEIDRDPAVRAAFAQRYRDAFELVPADVEAARVLDIGGGIGNFAQWAVDELGAETVVSDVDAGAVANARDRGLNAVVADEVDDVVPPGSIDVVTLWDVIEHAIDPGPLLDQAATSARADGVLLIETPDARFPLRPAVLGLRRVSGGRADLTGPLYYWEHKAYYTERGLRSLLARHGFDVTPVERWTSPSAKLVRTLGEISTEGVGMSAHVTRWIGRCYPVIDRIVRRLGAGNKLIVVARRRSDG